MTVLELITELQKYPADTKILIWRSHPDMDDFVLASPELEVHDHTDNGETISHIELV